MLTRDGCNPRQTTLDPAQTDAVLFDLDNTLVPFLAPLRAWAKTWARTASPPDLHGAVTKALLEHTLRGQEDRERAIEHAVETWALHDLATRASERAKLAYEAALCPYEGVTEMLDALERRGLSIALVTDAPRERAYERLHATNLSTRFELVLTRDDTPYGKQGPEPFHRALSELGLEPHRAAMVGDWPVYDVRWPKRLGMRTVLAGWGSQTEHPGSPADAPWAIASAPDEIPGLLAAQPSLQVEAALGWREDRAARTAAWESGVTPA